MVDITFSKSIYPSICEDKEKVMKQKILLECLFLKF